MSWLIFGFWGCLAMWLISLAGDLGLARRTDAPVGMFWVPLLSATVAFIGMCFFGNAAGMFGL